MSSHTVRVFLRHAMSVVLLTLAPVCSILAQSTLSQNQDGFFGETMDGFMNMDPDKDSTVVERTVSHDYWQWVIDRNTGLPTVIEPDSIHHSFHNAHLTEGMYGTYSHLGNMGSPRLSRLYFERKPFKDFIFDAPYDSWVKSPQDFRFTDTKTPHLNLTYFKGGNKRTGEEHIKGYFAANFNKKVGIGLDMDYSLGRGRYDSQSTSLFDARLYAYYRGDIYNMYVTANRDDMKISENGGIQDHRYITSPEAMAEGRKQYSPEDIPFRLYYNWNNLKRTQGMFNQHITLRAQHERLDSIGDTVFARTEYVEYGKIAHTLEIGKLQKRYINYQIPAGFYQRSFMHNDSIDNLDNFYVTNTISASLIEGFRKWAFAGLSAFARFDYQQFSMPDTVQGTPTSEFVHKYSKGNFSIGGQLEKTAGENLNFRAGIETVVAGTNIGNITIDGNLELKYPIWGKEARIGANAMMSALDSPFFSEQFHSTFAWWDKNFKKEFKTHIGGYLDIEKTGTRLQVDVENVSQYIYLKNTAGAHVNDDGVSQPMYNITADQYDGSIQIVSATLQQNFKLGPLHWDNHITYQLSGNRKIIPLPDLNVFSDLYFKFIYYKRLHMEVGANALFFTRYDAPAYCPVVGMYHLQNEDCIQQVGGYPLVTGYINCYLRGVRFYVMYYHANDGLLSNRDSFIVPGYPANPGMFKFGLSWTLFD